ARQIVIFNELHVHSRMTLIVAYSNRGEHEKAAALLPSIDPRALVYCNPTLKQDYFRFRHTLSASRLATDPKQALALASQTISLMNKYATEKRFQELKLQCQEIARDAELRLQSAHERTKPK
ncbi:MAG: hypothetical protein K2Z81_27270, partial [Cyanobacteria bacterium]|nr:hypothetical protein [Cyanobacteriota bacterium]